MAFHAWWFGAGRTALAAALAIMAAWPAPAQVPAVDARQQWRALKARVDEAYKARDYAGSITLAEQALAFARKELGDRDASTLASINNLAFLYRNQHRYGDAEPLYREVLQASREVFGPRDSRTQISLHNLAQLYLDQSRYGDAEPLVREELQVRREMRGPRHPDTLASLNNLAVIYRAQGQYDKAEPLFQEALQASREQLGPRDPDTLISINNLAALYQTQGRYGDAEPLFREALQANREVLGPRDPATLISVNNLAVIYRDQGRYGDAEPLFREALQGRREVLGLRHPDTLTSLNNLAILHQAQGRYGDAEKLFREALPASREVLGPHHPNTLQFQLNMATVLINQGRRVEAVQLLRQMEPNLLAWIGQELHSTEAGASRRQLVSSHSDFQHAVLSLATADSSPDARRLAATVMLHFKVMQGEEEGYIARLARRSQDPRVQTLANDIRALRGALAEAVREAPNTFEKTLQTLEGKRRELIAASPEYENSLRVQNASLDDVREALPAGAALVEFRQFQPADFSTGKLGEPRLAGLLLAGSDEPVVLDLGPVSELIQAATPPAEQAAAKLYERLFAPFEQTIAAATAVYVASEALLNLVPFAGLKLADGRYWSERQEIHLLQSGRDLLRRNAEAPARGLLALGGIDFDAGVIASPRGRIFFPAAGADRSAAVTRTAETFRGGFAPLPATAEEVKDVTEWYKQVRRNEPAEIWSGADANKARLMALKTPPRVLHLATHGFYRPNDSSEPMLLSGIALAGANRELKGAGDGLLFALEAEGLNLDGTELVVLSACDTAQGGLDYSEGVFGLARALRIAGARNVLVTLARVGDQSTRDFMVDFYKKWLTQARSDPAKALRDTQLSWMKKTDQRRDPYAWAPYVLIE